MIRLWSYHPGRVPRWAVLAAMCGLGLACGDSGGTGPTQDPVVTTVSVTPGTVTLTSLGSTQQLTATAKDENGAAMSGVTFTWSSSAPAVAAVAGDGTVTAVANGTATITATASGKSGSAAATVDVKGALRIVTDATGESGALDPNGYAAAVDGATRVIGVRDTVVVSNLAVGNRTVELSDVAANCTVSDANPRTVAVVAGDTVETTFAVDCTTEVGMARWVLDLSTGCAYPVGCLGQDVALGSDGTIYVVSAEAGILHAVNPDGTIAWSQATSVWYPPVVAANGTIFVAGESTMDAFDPGGTLVWTYDTGGSIESPTALGADGTVYFGSNGKDSKSLYALNPDGTRKWTHAVSESRFGIRHLAVGADGTVYAAVVDSGYGGTLIAIGADGSRKWSFPTLGQIGGAPAIDSDGTIYVGATSQTVPYAFDGKLYAVNPDGTLKWSYQTQGNVFYSATIAADGTIYVGAENGSFYAVNPDGSLKWSYPMPSCPGGGATVGADGLVYVPIAGCVYGGVGVLVVLDPDGSKVWDFQVSGTFKVIIGAPALAGDGTLYLVSEIEGDLYALKTSSLGLADTPWPRAHHDNRNSGRAAIAVP